jgi:hypothetical protein
MKIACMSERHKRAAVVAAQMIGFGNRQRVGEDDLES